MNVRSLLRKAVLPLVLAGALGSTPAAAAPETYEVDAVHSTVLFRIQHAKAGNQYGRFNDMSGTFTLDDANPSAASVKLEVKAGSIDTANAKRDDHLRGPDFFNVAQFPTITFVSTAVAKAGEHAFDVTGDLTLHGVKKSVTVRMEKVGAAKDPWGNFRAGFEGVLTIKRSDFDMKNMLEVVSDEVRLILAFEGIRK
jgi:polyisoprenoid-binding protein YceI